MRARAAGANERLVHWSSLLLQLALCNAASGLEAHLRKPESDPDRRKRTLGTVRVSDQTFQRSRRRGKEGMQMRTRMRSYCQVVCTVLEIRAIFLYELVEDAERQKLKNIQSEFEGILIMASRNAQPYPDRI